MAYRAHWALASGSANSPSARSILANIPHSVAEGSEKGYNASPVQPSPPDPRTTITAALGDCQTVWSRPFSPRDQPGATDYAGFPAPYLQKQTTGGSVAEQRSPPSAREKTGLSSEGSPDRGLDRALVHTSNFGLICCTGYRIMEARFGRDSNLSGVREASVPPVPAPVHIANWSDTMETAHPLQKRMKSRRSFRSENPKALSMWSEMAMNTFFFFFTYLLYGGGRRCRHWD